MKHKLVWTSREENVRKSSEFTPWYSGQNKFASQKGTGGFMKVRDVLPHTIVTFTVSFDVLPHVTYQFVCLGWQRDTRG